MCDISIREYIRWLPDESSEPTSTIVLTTPERRFVDIRVLKPLPSDPATDPSIPLSRLDWAMAGTSESSLVDGTRHSRWHHWIDSRVADGEDVVDEGDMFDHPSDPALTLERGRMANPATGAQTDYEELWRSEPVAAVQGNVTCLALQWQGASDGKSDAGGKVRRGFVVRLGEYCQGFARDGNDITLERLKWNPDQQRWCTQIRIGGQELPTEIATYLAQDVKIDDEVKVGGAVWKVVEKEESALAG